MDVGLDFNFENPDQNWFQSEPSHNPVPPGVSEYDWYLWRQKVNDGMGEAEAWQSILDQNAGPSNIMPNNIAGPSNYQSYNTAIQDPDNFSIPYGSDINDPGQNAFMSMSEIFPLPSGPLSFDTHNPEQLPSNTINPSVIATVPPAILPIQRTYTPPPDPSVCPLDSLVEASQPNPHLQRAAAPLILTQVTHRKRPIAPSPFIDPTPVRSGSGPEYSSSSVKRLPQAGKKQEVDAKTSTSLAFPAGSATHRPVITIKPVDMSSIRASLAPEALRGAKPIPLFKNLRSRISGQETLPPIFTPNPDELLEIITALKDHAPKEYLRAMADDEKYTIVLRKWLRKCIKEPKEWSKVTAPLLDMLSRTDMPVDFIVEHKFGKQAVQAKASALEQGLPNAKEIAASSDRYVNYITEVLIPANRRLSKEADDETAVKKRKLGDGSSKDVIDITGGPSRPSTSTASKERDKAAPAAGRATSDMTFFPAPQPKSSAFQPRTKLPDIKKRERDTSSGPGSTALPPAPNSAGESLLDKTLKMLRQGNSGPGLHTGSTAANARLPGPLLKLPQKKPNKKGHLVRFIDSIPDGGPLEAVRLFKEAAHELEAAPWQTDQDDVHGASAHDLDMGEGKALRRNEEMEEEIPWYEPHPYAFTDDPAYTLHNPTPETIDQDNRELGILAVNYPGGHVPSDPDETDVKIVQIGETTMMWEPAVRPALAAAQPPAASASVSALLGQLNPSLFAQAATHDQPPTNYYGGYPLQPAPSGPPQNQAYDYGYAHSLPQHQAYPQQAFEAAPTQGWGAQSYPYDNNNGAGAYHDRGNRDQDHHRGGRGKRHGGRGGGSNRGRRDETWR